MKAAQLLHVAKRAGCQAVGRAFGEHGNICGRWLKRFVDGFAPIYPASTFRDYQKGVETVSGQLIAGYTWIFAEKLQNDPKSACPKRFCSPKALAQWGTPSFTSVRFPYTLWSGGRGAGGRWMSRNSPTYRKPAKTMKLPYLECVLRVHIFFRNLTRTRAMYEPICLQVDTYDHAPFFRRMGGGETVVERGAKPVALENTSDSR